MKPQYSIFFKRTFLAIVFIILGNCQLNAQILSNGDFESGGSGIGFLVHDYTLINPLNGTSNPGFYGRTTNPTIMNSTYISGGDHTTGTGNMLVFDGATAGNKFFWTTGNTGGAIGGFTAGTTYTFSYWIKSVSNAVTDDSSTRANIGVFFVNANGINPTNLNNLAPLPSEGWKKISYSFVATANNVMVRLRTINAGPIGNDFAVDDFSITEGALPFTGTYSSINPTCPGATDGSITVSASGGFLPYGNYNLTGTATQSNTTGIFTGLGEGTYSVTVSDANNQVYSETNIVLTVQNDLILSSPVTICEGETTALSATGGIGSYTWTANPSDSSITNPNSATQNVSPTVTTIYTVTSGQASDPTNLVVNGDFSQGNVGFITEYSEVADPSPFGVQSSYFIVTNPNNWFAPFASCGDHTTGTGNMMIFDGSTDPTGTIKVWSTETPVTVEPNTDYTFSYYIASVAPENPAKIEITINGVSLAAPVTAPSTTCLWTLVSHNWNSGSNTTADITMFNREFVGTGNDFAIDDLSLAETVTCIYEKTVTVTVNEKITPTFNSVNPICEGGTLSALPTTSLNGYTGVWSPALNNQDTTTYTFTPTAGQCASTAELIIVVNAPVIPNFTAVNPICEGEALTALPTTSTDGFTGSWSPALNNQDTTTYTFTPTAGQCAINAELTIVVNSLVTPDFVAVSPVCSGDTLDALPTTSTDGFTGSWLPALNNSATTTYTFTPNAGQCATNAELIITVNQLPEFTISEGCVGSSYTLSAIETDATNSTYEWYNPSNIQIGTESSVVVSTAGMHKLIVTKNGCSDEQNVNVLAPFCSIQKGISPNNDTENDNFDLSAYNVSNLKIFNRYGTTVYSKSSYQDEWYGQSDSGDELPDGTYYYVIDFSDLETKTGWIYVNREQ